MRTGKKAQGQDAMAKTCVIRHGHGPRRGCNAAEKAIETRVRQAGKQEVRLSAWEAVDALYESILEKQGEAPEFGPSPFRS